MLLTLLDRVPREGTIQVQHISSGFEQFGQSCLKCYTTDRNVLDQGIFRSRILKLDRIALRPSPPSYRLRIRNPETACRGISASSGPARG